MKPINDYKLLYLYYLADKEGKLRGKHKSEYERLSALYSIDRAKKESKDYLEELGYIEYTGEGELKNGEWIVTKEADKENPFKITQKGLDVLGQKTFKSETANNLSKINIIGWVIGALGLILTIVLWLLDHFLKK